jgi:hypothetical protein
MREREKREIISAHRIAIGKTEVVAILEKGRC